MSKDIKTWSDLFRGIQGDEPYTPEPTGSKDADEVPFEDTITKMEACFGWTLYRSDGKAEIHRKLLRSLFCSHEMEPVVYSTGGGWMADVYKGEVCTKCGTKKIHKV